MNPQQGDPLKHENPGFARLTAREKDCLRALREHGQAKPAARALSITPETLNEHLANARRKLGVARSWTAARLLAEWDANQQAVQPASEAVGTDSPAAGDTPVPEPRGLVDDGLTRLGAWAGPLLVALAAAALALITVTAWATVELALRFESLR